MNTKSEKLLNLAKVRQTSTYEGYYNISDFDDGIWECDFVSPFSKSSNNSNSDILLILQDWSSVEGMSGPFCQQSFDLGYDPKVRTNINMIQLLREHFSKELDEVYTTNLFPYIKAGAMNSFISSKLMRQAAQDFTLPMVEIIKPKIAVCFGLGTYNALISVLGYKVFPRMAEAIDSPVFYNGTQIYCQSHPGQLGRNNRNRGGIDRVSQDWNKMKSDFHSMVSN